MHPESGLDTLLTVDCHYQGLRRAAAYLLLEADRVAFADNNTVYSVPQLLEALSAVGYKPEQVEYLIVTHVHLDHAGGTAELLKHCPNATILAHQRAARHLIDPSRLVAGATQVYGEERFNAWYGTINPIDEARVQIVEDEAQIVLGTRSLRVMYTAGHAKHHFSLYDNQTNSVIAGDAFGLSYPDLQNGTKPFVFCSTSPTDFDPDEARKSVQRILDTGADRVHVTHYGTITDPRAAAPLLLHAIDRMEIVQSEAIASGLEGDALEAFCKQRVTEEVYRLYEDTGAVLTDVDRDNLELDIWLNYGGINFNAGKARSA